MSLKLNHSRDYHNLLNNVIDNELESNDKPNNEVLWVQMGNQLEIEGVEKNQISKIMRKDIEDLLYEKQFKEFMDRSDYRWHNGSYWLVTKKNGWTDNTMARHVLDPAQDQDNSSLNTNNQGMIDIFSHIKQICDIGIVKAKEMKPFEDIFGKKITREFYKQTMSIIENCKYAFDGKTKVPTNTEQVLLECIAVASGDLTDGGVMYMKARTQLLEEQKKDILTTKQLSRYQNGDKISDLYLLKPHSRDYAIFLDYLGIQCIECDGWRIRRTLDYSDVECYDCGKQFTAKTITKCRCCQTPLYKEQLQHIIKTGKCENCNTENNIPEELIIYAKN